MLSCRRLLFLPARVFPRSFSVLRVTRNFTRGLGSPYTKKLSTQCALQQLFFSEEGHWQILPWYHEFRRNVFCTDNVVTVSLDAFLLNAVYPSLPLNGFIASFV